MKKYRLKLVKQFKVNGDKDLKDFTEGIIKTVLSTVKLLKNKQQVD